MHSGVRDFMDSVKRRDPNQPEFLQAVEEVVESVWPVLEQRPELRKAKILERIVEPERAFQFRVPWVDDQGNVQVNRGFRVQFSSAIGPYKGGLRFHPSVNLSILKFLGFEQIFKNSLTTTPIGGGKGGSDFDPRGKSDMEVMRFCQSFMTELFRHVGADTDVPAGDIGVGGREIGFLFGQYKRLANRFDGVLTGKGVGWGGSLIRPEATGFGVVYFAQEALKVNGEDMKGKRVAVSGFGNVAWGVCLKCEELGAKVVTVSGPDGYVYDEAGVRGEKIKFLLDMRASNRDQVKDYADKFGVPFYAGKRPWEVPCDIAFPCATQNEVALADAQNLVANKCRYLVEGANMPTLPDAVHHLMTNGIVVGPAKAANAGGVACSALEMAQNSMRLSWTREEVDQRLHSIMINIHNACREASAAYGMPGNLVAGANIAGFVKVANAMMDQGIV